MTQAHAYIGGMSRGDTPRSGATTARERCPFWLDESMPFSARGDTMSLNVIKKDDVPPGPLKFAKDSDFSLTTHDILRAQPVLAHRSCAAGVPIPWAAIQKVEQPTIALSSPRPLYPPIRHHRRRCDHSLTTADIERAQPKKIERTAIGRPRSELVRDNITPSYLFPTSWAAPLEQLRSSGKNALDVTDIEGAAPLSAFPPRRQYTDTMRCEPEFRSKASGEAQR